VLRLILSSKLPSAVKFERWVFEEVLPAIRKSGGYMVAAPTETHEELAVRALLVLQATVERQKAQLAAVLPKAEALDRIATDGSFSITAAAKALQVRPKDLFSYLPQHGLIDKRAGNAIRRPPLELRPVRTCCGRGGDRHAARCAGAALAGSLG